MSSNWAHRFTRWRPHYRRWCTATTCPTWIRFVTNCQLPAHRPASRARLCRSGWPSRHTASQKAVQRWVPRRRLQPQPSMTASLSQQAMRLSLLLPAIMRELDEAPDLLQLQELAAAQLHHRRTPPGLHPARSTWSSSTFARMEDTNAILVFVETAFPSGIAPKPADIGRRRVGFRVLVNWHCRAARPHPPAR